MRIVRVMAAVLLGAVGTAAAGAQALTGEEERRVEAAIGEVRGGLRTLELEFRQRVVLEEDGEHFESRGVLRYAAPGRLRMDYVEPEGEALLVRRDLIVIAKKGLRPRVKRPQAGEPPEKHGELMFLEAFERPPAEWRKDFAVRMERREEGLVMFLEQDREERLPRRLEIVWEPGGWWMRELRLYPPGVRVRYEFSRPKVNGKIREEVFEWTFH